MKKNMKKIHIKVFFLLILISSLVSCDFNLDKVNPNSITVENFYQTEGDLANAVNSVYAVLQDQTLVSREWFFVHDLRGDDMATGGGQLETPRYQLLIGTNDPANFVASSVWTGCYAVIHRANVVIEKAPGVKSIDETKRTRLVGEAKFLRGWAYFELVSLWGGVPLYNEYVKDLSGAKSRSTVDEVYASVIANLQDAISGLPASYSGGDVGRATKGAAQALLARVYMQKGDYASAKPLLKSIIDSKLYRLVDNYNDNFMEETEYNGESVFEVGFMDSNAAFSWGYNNGDGLGAETTVHNQEISPISWGNLIPSQKLLEEYESTDVAGNTKTDPRYKFSFYEVGDNIVTGPLTLASFNIASSSIRGGAAKKVGWRKHTILYKNAASYYPGGINERIIRYAEVLLMMAECQNETGESETDVLATLNQIRDRASVNMPHYPTANYPTGSKDARFKAIAHEKRVELAGEEIRNRDILRWRKQGKLTILGGDPITYFAANKYELLPLPQTEIDNNINVGKANQNPGY
jgi:starch-binding outer membrane protein, SusD/RagB family